jgi:uncharacterized protein with HEPN domain
MNERDKTYIERINDELLFILKATDQIDKEAFLLDDVMQHAITMSLLSVGECANHLSEKFKKSHPHIQWIQIIAVRNIASHGYWQLNMEQIWQAVEEDIPNLIKFFRQFS